MELKQRVFLAADDDTVRRFAATNRAIRTIALQMPEMPWQQRALHRALRTPFETPFLQALGAARFALRVAPEAVSLPSGASQNVLDTVARMVRGSKQRPTVLYGYGTPELARISHIPPEIDAMVSLEPWYIGAEWSRKREILHNAVRTFTLPPGVRRVNVQMQSEAQPVLMDFSDGAQVHKIKIPEGIEEVSLALNCLYQIGADIQELALPTSVRCLDLTQNGIAKEHIDALRQKYPDVEILWSLNDRFYEGSTPHYPLDTFYTCVVQ